LTVGDPLALTLSINHPADTQALVPLLGKNWGDFEVRDQTPVAIAENPDGSLRTTQTFEVTLFAPGAYATPSLIVTISDATGKLSEAAVPPLDVTVASVLNPGQQTLRDIKGQASLPISPNRWPLAAVLMALIGMGGVSWLVLRRIGQRKSMQPPLGEALAALAQLEQLDYVGQGNYKLHYMLATETLRRYIDSVYGIPALDMTTAEVDAVLDGSKINQRRAEEIVAILADADLVKFAKLTPSEETAHGLIDDVRALLSGLAREMAAQAAADEVASKRVGPTSPIAIDNAQGSA
jgi:hypothetical protein